MLLFFFSLSYFPVQSGCGTFVNDAEIIGAYDLKINDKIGLGISEMRYNDASLGIEKKDAYLFILLKTSAAISPPPPPTALSPSHIIEKEQEIIEISSDPSDDNAAKPSTTNSSSSTKKITIKNVARVSVKPKVCDILFCYTFSFLL